jgi:hypothetical protein
VSAAKLRSVKTTSPDKQPATPEEFLELLERCTPDQLQRIRSRASYLLGQAGAPEVPAEMGTHDLTYHQARALVRLAIAALMPSDQGQLVTDAVFTLEAAEEPFASIDS